LKNKLFRYARRILVGIEDTEDVIQEVFIKLWSKRDRLSEYRSIEAFAMVVTRNLCLDKIKARKLRMTTDSNNEMAIDETPYSKTELRDTIKSVQHYIDSLPEQQRSVIHLRDVEGMEFEEIAEITGMNMNAIRVNLSRARKKVRDALIKRQHYEYSEN
jgi:RNA polymerase sigma-70 factor (ECF subfamily)